MKLRYRPSREVETAPAFATEEPRLKLRADPLRISLLGAILLVMAILVLASSATGAAWKKPPNVPFKVANHAAKVAAPKLVRRLLKQETYRRESAGTGTEVETYTFRFHHVVPCRILRFRAETFVGCQVFVEQDYSIYLENNGAKEACGEFNCSCHTASQCEGCAVYSDWTVNPKFYTPQQVERLRKHLKSRFVLTYVVLPYSKKWRLVVKWDSYYTKEGGSCRA